MTAKKMSVAKQPAKASATPKIKSTTSDKQRQTKSSDEPTASGAAGAKNFLQSSFGAISRSRDDATEAVAEGLGRFVETIGLRKLEDVFDQRVASALERMGIPTARELARLRDRVEQLSQQVNELKSKQRK